VEFTHCFNTWRPTYVLRRITWFSEEYW